MSDPQITIYHNPRCSKSRQTLQKIRDAGIEPTVVEYLQKPPTVDELDGILTKLRQEPIDVMRRKEAVFRELGLGSADLVRADAIAAMVQNPILIERPIVVRGDKAVIGRPPENVDELLG